MSQSLSSERARERERLAHKKCVNPGVIFGPFGGNCGPFWVIFGPLWIILGHLGSYLGHLGPFCAFSAKKLRKIQFFSGPVGAMGLAFRMYATKQTKKPSNQSRAKTCFYKFSLFVENCHRPGYLVTMCKYWPQYQAKCYIFSSCWMVFAGIFPI